MSTEVATTSIPKRDVIFVETWKKGNWLQKGLLILAIPFCLLSIYPVPLSAMFFVTWDDVSENARKKRELKYNQARELLRNFKVEYRVRHGFLASGKGRELIQREHPLTDPELDELMKTIKPEDVLREEID